MIADALRDEADAIVAEATTTTAGSPSSGSRSCRPSEFGPLRILTHCNTGPLACGQFGTALGIVQAAHHAGREISVWVDETRPYLQGARLTAWELEQAGVPHTLIPDVAAGSLMRRRRGRRRPRRRGPGRRERRHGEQGRDVPAAPSSPPATASRSSSARRRPRSTSTTPDGDGDRDRGAPGRRGPADPRLLDRARPGPSVRNPSFDVTPAELISGIVTEEGVVERAVRAGLAAAVASANARWAATAPRTLRATGAAPTAAGVEAAG